MILDVRDDGKAAARPCARAHSSRPAAGQLAGGWLAAFPFFLVYGMNVVAWEDLVKLISGIKKADTEPDTTEADSARERSTSAHREGLGDGRQGPSLSGRPASRAPPRASHTCAPPVHCSGERPGGLHAGRGPHQPARAPPV